MCRLAWESPVSGMLKFDPNSSDQPVLFDHSYLGHCEHDRSNMAIAIKRA